MDNTEYLIKKDEIKSLISQREYALAAEIADTIDWRRVRSVMMLCTISDLYKINRRYEDAKNMLLLAYDIRPGGRAICYSLCELCIKMEEYVQAVKYYKEYVQVAPKDSDRYILQYKLYEAQDVSLEERIEVLKELKKRDYREKWAYELAYLYHRVGQATLCVEECDELILWFGEGKYVYKAMELKMLHQPLSPSQQEKYDHRFGNSMEESACGETQTQQGEVFEGQPETAQTLSYDGLYGDPAVRPAENREDIDIQVKTVDVGQYNTINLQAELAEGLKEVLGRENRAEGDAITRALFAPMLESDTERLDPLELEEEEEEELVPEPEGTEVFFGETSEIGSVLPDTVPELEQRACREERAPWETMPEEESVPEPEAGPGLSGEENGLSADGTAELAMEQMRMENSGAEQVLTVQPPRELAGVLSQESDGQISLVVPEREVVEKQITGQMSIQDILSEWERMKKENEEKRREEVRQRVLEQTGSMFTDFEEAVRDNLLEQLEGGSISAEEQMKEAEQVADAEERLHPSRPEPDGSEGENVAEEEETDWEEARHEGREETEEELEDLTEELSETQPEAVDETVDLPESEAQEEVSAEETALAEESLEDFGEEFPEDCEEEAPEELGEESPEELGEESPEDIGEEFPEELGEESREDMGEEFPEDIEEEFPEDIEEEFPEDIGEESREDIEEEFPEDVGEESSEALEEEFPEDVGEESSEALEEEFPEGCEEEASEELGGETLEEREETPEEESGWETEAEAEEDFGENSEEGFSEEPGEELPEESAGEEEKPSEEEDLPEEAQEQLPRVRKLTKEEKELFAPFVQSRCAREQLVSAIDNVSMAAFTGNIVVTGEEGMDTITLAKNMIRDIQMTDSNFSGKVAKISGHGLNSKNVSDIVDQLRNGALIVQKASGLNAPTADALQRALQQENVGIIVVLEDTKKGIARLLEANPELAESFTARMDIEALSNDMLVAFGRQYAREMEYSIDDLGVLALHTRIEQLQTIDHAVTVMEVKKIIDDAIRHANRKTLGHFFDVLFARRYDDEDMIVLTEKDFV